MVENPSDILIKQVIPENLANQKGGTLFNPFQHFVSRLIIVQYLNLENLRLFYLYQII